MRPRGWRVLTGAASRPGVFEEVLLQQLDGLYGLALRLTRNPSTAEDLLQDAVLRAFERFGQLRDPAAARAWFVKILTTTFLNHYAGPPREDGLDAAGHALDQDTPEAALLRQCDAEEVEAALAELPQDFRVTVLLSDVEELPLREIASLCGCPLGTTASRLARARKMLRERLQRSRTAREEA